MAQYSTYVIMRVLLSLYFLAAIASAAIISSQLNLGSLVFVDLQSSIPIVLTTLGVRSSQLSSRVLPPSLDPFYVPGKGYELTIPGTILRIRVVPSRLRSIILPVQVKNSWQVLVRSTDSHGNATAIVATIMEPFNADPSKLVSYQVAEDSSSPDCAISYAIQTVAPKFGTLVSQVDMVMAQAFMEQGWYVVAADYEGPQAALTIGRQAAHGVLDGLRAALMSNFTGINNDAKTIFYGYSGGSIASAWAAALQPKYAPELKSNLLGCAMGGFITNITAVAEVLEGSIFAGLVPSSIMGWVNENPALLDVAVQNSASQAKLDLLLESRNKCLMDLIVDYFGTYTFTGPDRYFTDGFGMFDNPIIKQILQTNTLAIFNDTEIPEIPLFVFQSKNDEVAPYTSALRAYDNWCDWGIESFEFAVDHISEHVTEFIAGGPAGFSWMKAIFNGTEPIKGCQRTERVTNLQYPGAWGSLVEILGISLKSLMQENIGPLSS